MSLLLLLRPPPAPVAPKPTGHRTIKVAARPGLAVGARATSASVPARRSIVVPARSAIAVPGRIGQTLSPRLAIVGSRIIGPDGRDFRPVGLNFSADAAVPDDAIWAKSLGATCCRVVIAWHNDSTGSCSGTFPGSANDAYAPDQPGCLNPQLLGYLDQKIYALAAQGIWVSIAMSGFDCVDYNDPVVGPQWLSLWTFLAARYRRTPYVAWYEPLVEPHPYLDKYNAAKLRGAHDRVVAAIRAVDDRTPIALGAPSNPTSHNTGQIVRSDPNIVYIGNFYEPPSYVKQVKKGGGPYTGYPSNPIQPDPLFPLYPDDKGGQPNVSYGYDGQGQDVFLNKNWLGTYGYGVNGGLLSMATRARDTFNVPVWIDQVGLRSATPNSLDYASDVLDNFNQAGIGWCYWVARGNKDRTSVADPAFTGGAGGGNSGDISIWFQDNAGAWFVKDGTHGTQDWVGLLRRRIAEATA